MNLGISEAFGQVEYDKLMFPSTMRMDYIRVYQDPNAINIGCDPSAFPTSAYISQCVPPHYDYVRQPLTSTTDASGTRRPMQTRI